MLAGISNKRHWNRTDVPSVGNSGSTSASGVLTDLMFVQEEDEEEEEDLQELMGHFRGMQVHLKHLLPARLMLCTCLIELFDSILCRALPPECPMRGPCSFPAQPLHGVCLCMLP